MLTESAELQGPLPVAPGPGASMLSFTHQAAQPIPAIISAITITTAAKIPVRLAVNLAPPPGPAA